MRTTMTGDEAGEREAQERQIPISNSISSGHWRRVDESMALLTNKTYPSIASEWHPALAQDCQSCAELERVGSHALREGQISLWMLCESLAKQRGWQDGFEKSGSVFFISAATGNRPKIALGALLNTWDAPIAQAAGDAFLALCLERERSPWREKEAEMETLDLLAQAPGALASLGAKKLSFALSKLPEKNAADIKSRFESEQIEAVISEVGAAGLASSGPKSL